MTKGKIRPPRTEFQTHDGQGARLWTQWWWLTSPQGKESRSLGKSSAKILARRYNTPRADIGVGNLPSEVINAIQTSLQLMGNANYHNTMARRNAILMQLNPRLKPLCSDADFKTAAPFLFEKALVTWLKNDWTLLLHSRRQLSWTEGEIGIFRKATPRGIMVAGVATSTAANTDTRVGRPVTKPPKATRNDN